MSYYSHQINDRKSAIEFLGRLYKDYLKFADEKGEPAISPREWVLYIKSLDQEDAEKLFEAFSNKEQFHLYNQERLNG